MTATVTVLESRARTLAVLGPFSSGKSSVINMIARRDLAAPGIGADGPVSSRYDLGGDAAFPVVIEARTDEDGLPPPDMADAIEAADLLVWCTIGSQAWRANEVSAMARLTATRSGPAVLAVTRADLFRSTEDVAKVQKRLSKATGDDFAEIVFIDASPEATAEADVDGPWRKAGGEILAGAMEAAMEAAAEAERAAAEAEAEAKRVAAEAEATLLSEEAPPPADEPSDETLEGVLILKPEPSTRARLEDGETASSDILDLAEFSKTRPGDPASQTTTSGVHEDMSTDITGLAGIAGFLGACMVDSETGLMLASEGGNAIDLETAGAANTEVVKAKLRAIEALGMSEGIEDILITLDSQFHLIRPLASNPMVFIYVALEKKAANLGLARIQVKNVEQSLTL